LGGLTASLVSLSSLSVVGLERCTGMGGGFLTVGLCLNQLKYFLLAVFNKEIKFGIDN
jgi:hypothetical protein